MNPESRIKLIRSIEEIKVFEENFGRNDSPKTRVFNRWFGLFFYLIIIIFIYNYDLKQKIFLLFITAIPAIAYSIWLYSKTKSDERFKLIANAILELGSIAQESPASELAPQKIRSIVVRAKKQTLKRKKK